MDEDFLLWLNIKLFLLSFLSFTLALAWKDNPVTRISQDIAKVGRVTSGIEDDYFRLGDFLHMH